MRIEKKKKKMSFVLSQHMTHSLSAIHSPILFCMNFSLKEYSNRWSCYLCAAAVPYPMSVSRGEVIASWKLIPNIPHNRPCADCCNFCCFFGGVYSKPKIKIFFTIYVLPISKWRYIDKRIIRRFTIMSLTIKSNR